MPQPHSLRHCLEESGLDDPSEGIRTFLQERSLHSVRALCGLQKGDTMKRQQLVTAGFDPSWLQFDDGADEGRLVFSHYYVPWRLPGLPAEDDPAEELGAQLKSNFGVLFLDRTRVVPKGSVLGEELLSLSLAPDEEVIVEQKTFSKREVSFEEQNEVEQQMSLEFDATLSTTLEEGLDFQQNHSSRTDSGLSGSIGGSISGVGVNVTPSFSTSVSDSDASTRRRSVKDTTSASSKVASRYRTAHKTVMRISTEDRFESTSKRTLRNPNTYTPIDLRYFKIYQSVQLSRERYGARLVWAPSISQPGLAMMQRVQAVYDQVLKTAMDALQLPEPPEKPVPPAAKPPKENVSEQWTAQGILAGGRATEEFTIANPDPANYQWDGDTGFMNTNIVLTDCEDSACPSEGPDYHVDGVPYADNAGNVRGKLSISWSGYGYVKIQVKANFLPTRDAVDDPAYKQQLAEYDQRRLAYNLRVQELRAQAQAAARTEAENVRAQVLAATDPLSECLSMLVNDWFKPEERSEAWKVDRWRSLFDWDNAAVSIYPGWWSSGTTSLVDPTRPGTDFVNASWARLYLPIWPGQETVATALALQIEQAHGTDITDVDFTSLIQDLSAYREEMFGSPEEISLDEDEGEPTANAAFIVLGTWTEVLPTNGTHLEVVQADTAAEDDVISDQLSSQKNTGDAQVASLRADADVKERLKGAVAKPKQIDVSVAVGDHNGQNTDG